MPDSPSCYAAQPWKRHSALTTYPHIAPRRFWQRFHFLVAASFAHNDKVRNPQAGVRYWSFTGRILTLSWTFHCFNSILLPASPIRDHLSSAFQVEGSGQRVILFNSSCPESGFHPAPPIMSPPPIDRRPENPHSIYHLIMFKQQSLFSSFSGGSSSGGTSAKHRAVQSRIFSLLFWKPYQDEFLQPAFGTCWCSKKVVRHNLGRFVSYVKVPRGKIPSCRERRRLRVLKWDREPLWWADTQGAAQFLWSGDPRHPSKLSCSQKINHRCKVIEWRSSCFVSVRCWKQVHEGKWSKKSNASVLNL
jgi:hypothetical protein